MMMLTRLIRPFSVLVLGSIWIAPSAHAAETCDGERLPALTALKSVRAVFPDTAFRRNVEGTVWIRMRVGEDGRASSVWVCRSSGDADLDAAGLQWFRETVFDVPARGSANRSPDDVYEDSIIFGLAREARFRGPAPSSLASVRPFRQPEPSYPRELINIGLEGEVTLVGAVSQNGRVQRVDIERSSGNAAFDAAAAAAVFQYEFLPQAQGFRFTRTFSFRLRPGSALNPADGQEVIRQ